MYNKIAHTFAGTLILSSLLLMYLTNNKNWLWVTAFVGLNLFQNGITNWCLLHQILKKIGVKDKDSNCNC